MAAFPPLPQIVGSHGGIYEGYYVQADPNGTGSIGALDAANFLKKSKLKDTTLSQIWDLSDPMGKGYLEKTGFFVALKLIALVQNSQEMSIAKLSTETPPPNLGPVEPVDPSAQTTISSNAPWDISLSEKSKYDKVFDSLQPVNNMLAGNKVKTVLMNSKLPVDVLGRIWDMSDIDKDGFLDRDEFALAMHLVYQSREGNELPPVLRPSLIPPSKRKGGGLGTGVAPPLAGAVPVLPGIIPVASSGVSTLGRSTPTQGLGGQPGVQWVVTPAEKTNADVIFKKLDTDLDGLVSGAETRDVMAQSGLQTTVLAHIWGLCDSQGVGKLNMEQFALAMYLIQQKLKGIDPPAQLTPEMTPPSMRSLADPGAFGVRDGTNAGPYSHVADFSAIKDLDHISKEIDDIKAEKLQLERDKAQQEADIKIRQSEVHGLQKELDNLTNTLSQLDSQKKEAQKRLDELDDKRSNLERTVQELRQETDKEQMEVNKMKSLLSNREQLIKDQERDLERLRTELSQLREEESKLEQTVDSSKQQLDMLAKSQADINGNIQLTRRRLQQFQEQFKGFEPSLTSHLNLNGDTSVETASNRATVGSPVSTISSFSVGSNLDDFKDDPFKGRDPFGGSAMGGDSDPQADPFQNDDPFRDSDPFISADPFGSEDPFKSTFGSDGVSGKSDPFGNLDPFSGGGGGGGTAATSAASGFDGFDAFGSSWTAPDSSSQKSSNSFPSDPFGGGSSTPASTTPTKQKKAPPPRPAPPKSKSPTPFTSSSSSSSKPKVDPFGGFGADPFGTNDPFLGSGAANSTSGNSSDPFANFADFSPGKFEENPATWGQ